MSASLTASSPHPPLAHFLPSCVGLGVSPSAPPFTAGAHLLTPPLLHCHHQAQSPSIPGVDGVGASPGSPGPGERPAPPPPPAPGAPPPECTLQPQSSRRATRHRAQACPPGGEGKRSLVPAPTTPTTSIRAARIWRAVNLAPSNKGREVGAPGLSQHSAEAGAERLAGSAR